MNPVAASFALAGLATVAAGGVLAGFLRDAPAPLEPPSDPLDDRRLALLRGLADLEEAWGSGALDEAEYERLRDETEGRMARVLRAIDRRGLRRSSGDRQDPVADVLPPADPEAREAEDLGPRADRSEGRRVPPWVVATLIGGTVLAVVISTLARDSSPATEAVPAPTGSTGAPLAFFEQRVEEHPDDLAARLDLAHRYLDAGKIEESLAQYAVALELDPDDAEAHAHVGIILYLSERPREALDSVDRALATDPGYPEALFFRGVILLRGLDRPEPAIAAFERYLDAAPFGAERGSAEELIAEAELALAEG
ncbi:MAG: tetratricopeptide repeat protein [Actinobacteria bacterium]|nr:tetratricopeptide repeat protein [Actinomycetota bacterium]